MTLTLTLNKEFLHPVFYCFQQKTYCLLYSYQWSTCTPLQKLSKTASKYVKFPFFHILEIVKICIFKQSRATHVCNIPYVFLFSHIEQSWYSIQVC